MRFSQQAASIFLNSSVPTEDIWVAGSTVESVCPLYNSAGNIVAYYVALSPDGYAVINNNIDNPVAIEYGEGRNDLIQEILCKSDHPHIIYNNPFEVYDANEGMPLTLSEQEIDITTYYPNLEDSNNELANIHAELKSLASNGVGTRALSPGDIQYGFLEESNLPSGYMSGRIIRNANNVDWAIYDDYKTSTIYDHCGAVAITNIALYYAECGKTNLKINNSKDQTFASVFSITGRGPKAMIAPDAEKYFSSRGYTLNYNDPSGDKSSFEGIQEAVKNNRPCGILLADALNNWHWVICVGWRVCGVQPYMQIVNGWANTTNRFYMGNSGSLWISTRQYWVS